jgi:hypothetical protein
MSSGAAQNEAAKPLPTELALRATTRLLQRSVIIHDRRQSRHRTRSGTNVSIYPYHYHHLPRL